MSKIKKEYIIYAGGALVVVLAIIFRKQISSLLIGGEGKSSNNSNSPNGSIGGSVGNSGAIMVKYVGADRVLGTNRTLKKGDSITVYSLQSQTGLNEYSYPYESSYGRSALILKANEISYPL